jgi:Family of unknown function (DUF6527)
MSRVDAVVSKGISERYSDALAHLVAPGDYVKVVRGAVRSLVMRCPDGCGEVITVNLDRRTGPAWRIFERSNYLTIYPSIWRDSGCRVHFIIWRNRILWCDRHEKDYWSDDALLHAVRQSLPASGAAHRHFEEIAIELAAVPWEVLWACQSLERNGIALSSEKGVKFGLRAKPSADSTSEHRSL